MPYVGNNTQNVFPTILGKYYYFIIIIMYFIFSLSLYPSLPALSFSISLLNAGYPKVVILSYFIQLGHFIS